MTENKDDVVITVSVPDWNEQGIFKDLITLECSDAPEEEVSTSVGDDDAKVVEQVPESHIELEYYPSDEQFPNASDITENRKISKDKHWKCLYCDFMDSKKANVVRHARCHTGERLFSCAFCSRSFTTKGVLDLHVRTHTKQHPYFCCKCGESFIGNTACVRHQKKRHGMVGKEVNMMFLKEDTSHLGEEQLIIRVKRNGHLYNGKFRFIRDHTMNS